MNQEGFRAFLKKQRRSQGTIEQCVRLTREFEAYLGEHQVGRGLDEAYPEDLKAFVSWKKKQRKSVNSHLWALHRYYEYTSNEPMHRLAIDIRQQRLDPPLSMPVTAAVIIPVGVRKFIIIITSKELDNTVPLP